MANQSVEVRASQDLIDQVDEYGNEHDLSTADAFCELARRGLQAVVVGRAGVEYAE